MAGVGGPGFDRALTRRRVTAADIFLGCLVVLVGAMLVAPGWVAPYSPTVFDPGASLLAPSPAHPFGTDEFGRDVLSRIIHGARPTLFVALLGALAGVSLGAATGLVAGYAGGALDEALMRFMDALMSFPTLILATLIVIMLGAHPVNVVGAIGIVFWPRSARIVRSVAVDVARRGFVDAARARGESDLFILWREILPNVRSIVIVDFGLRVTYGTLLSTSLSYLGIGVTPPTPAWGLMVKEGQQYIQFAPWLVVFPCLAISLAAIAAVMLGESVRTELAMTEKGRS